MTFRLFGRGDGCGTRLKLSPGHRSTVRWLPRLGDIFPDFVAQTTYGELQFHDWAAGTWTYLFSHPTPLGPAAADEIVDTARRRGALARLGIKPLLIACCSAAELTSRAEAIERTHDLPICFPMAADPRGMLAQAANMIHPAENARQVIRKSFILDPELRIRLIMDYPVDIGRNLDEIIRVVSALKVVERAEIRLKGDGSGSVPLPPVPAVMARPVATAAGPVPQGAARHLRLVRYEGKPVVRELQSSAPQGD